MIKEKISEIKEFFNINDSLVLDKLILICYPFYSSSEFLYKQDLYIPIVSFMTFILLSSLDLGIKGLFKPEKLFVSSSRNITVILILVGLYKLLFYLLGFSIGVLDILCFCGYRFVPMCIIKLSSLIIYRYVYYLIIVYLFVCYFFFISRSIYNHLQDLVNSKINEYGTHDLISSRKYLFVVSIIELTVIVIGIQ
ncbi:YIF1 [Hepatospora eriocheir]|uniref:Protein YIF1 n=1 Tax=Hepatospora eriocheir TaxID=1081669 RepID=A0A1X0QJF9_9MICR|nr:YIF1 [Hepatospora eriocheir]